MQTAKKIFVENTLIIRKKLKKHFFTCINYRLKTLESSKKPVKSRPSGLSACEDDIYGRIYQVKWNHWAGNPRHRSTFKAEETEGTILADISAKRFVEADLQFWHIYGENTHGKSEMSNNRIYDFDVFLAKSSGLEREGSVSPQGCTSCSSVLRRDNSRIAVRIKPMWWKTFTGIEEIMT